MECSCRFFVMMLMAVMLAGFSMDMSFMACMGFMIVAQMSCSQSGDEDRKPNEHSDALPAVMPFLFWAFMSFVGCFFMDNISVMTICNDTTFGMIFLCTAFLMYPVVDHVDNDTCDYGKHEEDSEYDECLIRDHGKHDECLVA